MNASAPIRFSFLGSSLVSAYWNGACTYYRGLIRALHDRGHRVTFYEPHAYQRQEHRDIPDPEWARVVVYEPTDAAAVRAVVARAAVDCDVLVKCSGVGVYDDVLEDAVAQAAGGTLRVFWDVDAPATLAAIERGEAAQLRELVREYDLVLTYGGGEPVRARYRALGARRCEPVYNALDPRTHHPVDPGDAPACDLLLLANRLPDRERRVQEFFFSAARAAPQRRFALGGNGWEGNPGEAAPPNVRYLGHVAPGCHNALNCAARMVLNVSRDGMAANGFSPATRVFEAAGAGACLITDAWEGIEQFLEPGSEVLVAHDGAEVARMLVQVSDERARRIGDAARERVLAEHTYARRAAQVQEILDEAVVTS